MTNKTVPTNQDVEDFLESLDNDRRKQDSYTLLQMMANASGEPAAMWGKTIVGFGQYHYRYDSGREGDFMRVGFSPRKANLSVYIIPGFSQYQALLEKLGKHKLGKSCLYINKLADVNLDVLQELITASLAEMAEKYPE